MAKNQLAKPNDSAMASITDVDAEDLLGFAEYAAFEGHEIERMIQIPEGRSLAGIYRGRGGDASLPNPTTGEVQVLPTYRIAPDGKAGVVVSVVGSAALARQLEAVPEGSHIVIARGGLVQTRAGRFVRDWIVAVKRA